MVWGGADVFSGGEGFHLVLGLVLWLGTWTLVSVVVGWFLQAVAILLIDWRHEKLKPMA